MEGGTNGQAASGAATWSCLVRSFRRPAGSLSVLFFGGVRCGGLTGGWWAISAALDGCRG